MADAWDDYLGPAPQAPAAVSAPVTAGGSDQWDSFLPPDAGPQVAGAAPVAGVVPTWRAAAGIAPGEVEPASVAAERQHALRTAAGIVLPTAAGILTGGAADLALAPATAALEGPGAALALGRAALTGISGAASGAAAGATTTPFTGGSVVGNALQGAEIGGALGAVVPPLVGYGASKLAGAIDPGVAANAEALRAQGIDVRAPALVMSGDPAALRQYTSGVSRLIGADTDTITPQVMNSAKARIQGVFNDVAKSTSISAKDPMLLNSLVRTESAASSELPVGAPAIGQVQKVIDQIQDTLADKGQISGATYQALTKRGGAVQDLMDDPATAKYGIALRESLDDALERVSPPGKLGDLQQARQQWRNLSLVGGSADATTGLVDPKKFASLATRRWRDPATGAWSQFAPQDVQTLAEGSDFVGRPTTTGGVRAAPSHLTWPAIIGGAGAGELALEYAPEAMHTLISHPVAAMIGAGMGYGGLLAARGAVNSDAMTNILINNALGRSAIGAPNWLIGPSVTGANALAPQR